MRLVGYLKRNLLRCKVHYTLQAMNMTPDFVGSARTLEVYLQLLGLNLECSNNNLC